MTEDTSGKENQRNYFRVPCEFQLRHRVLEDQEFEVFKSFALRPSPYSSLKVEIENQLNNLPVGASSRLLFEKAFQILVNIDQRLERLEETFNQYIQGSEKLEAYEWVTGNLGAGGLEFIHEGKKKYKENQKTN